MKKKIGVLLILAILLTTLMALATVNTLAADSHTVSFYLDSNRLYQTQTVSNGSYAEIPDTPAKNGSAFEYWTKDGDKFSFATPITADTVLVAEWYTEQYFYTVTFKVGDKTVSTQEVADGESAIAPANPPVDIAGKEFDGWDGNYSSITSDTVITARLKNKQYTVKTIGFDGTVIDTETVEHGQSFTPITPPEVANHSFLEYEYEGELSSVQSDMKIYIIYKPDTYEVTFYSEGLQFGDKAEVEYGDSVLFPASVPSKENYIFIGWYTAAEGGEMYTFNEALDGNLSLYARFIPIEKPKFTVIFHDHSGNQYGGEQRVEKGTAAVEPGAPYSEGYTFLRWNTDFSEVTQDLDIYPIYSVNKYTVTFIDSEGTLKVFKDISHGTGINDSDIGEVNVPVGKEFVCWDKSLKSITEDTVITAVYSNKKYVVMFYNEQNQKIGVTQYIEHGSSAKIPNMSDKTGYTFIGWEAGNGATPDSITDDCIFFARYEKNKYTVSFNEGSENVSSSEVLYGDKAGLYSYEKSDFIFMGWYTDSSLTQRYDFNSAVTENLTLYAKWEQKPETVFTVIFMSDNALVNRQSVVEGGEPTLPANPTKYGYTFEYWQDIMTGERAVLDSITEDMTVVAVFKKNTYTVKFHINGEIVEKTVEHGEAATAPEQIPEKEGYDFAGWDKSFDEVLDNIEVKPKWTIKSFTVTFVDGNNIIHQESVEYLGRATLIPTPQKSGYTFERWIDGEGNAFYFSTPIVGNTTVHASFKASTYTIHYYINGILYREITLPYGSEIALLGEPTADELPENIVFLGWENAPETMPAENIDINAKVRILGYYKVTYYLDGKLYASFEILEGARLDILEAPELDDKYQFSGWSDIPETMPAKDIEIYGTTMPSLKNAVRFEKLITDDGLHLQIYVEQDVEFAAILTSVKVGTGFEILTYYTANGAGEFHIDENGILRFVWAEGENTTAPTLLLKLVLATKDTAALDGIGELKVEDIKAFDADGNIISADYTIIN